MADHQDDSLTKLKLILGDHEEEFTVAEIMAEEYYEKATDVRKNKEADEPLSQATQSLKSLAEEIEQFAIQQAIAAESETAPEPRPAPVIDFGSQLDFENAFKPSGSYIRTEDGELEDEEKEPERGPSLWQRWLDIANADSRSRADMTPGAACHAAARPLFWMRLRVLLAPALLIPMIYITVAQKAPLPLSDGLSYFTNNTRFLTVTAIMQILILLLCADLVAEGLRELATLRLGRYFALIVNNIACLAHIFSIFNNPAAGYAFVPASALASLATGIALWARYLEESAYYRSWRVASALAEPTGILREEALFEGQGVFVRQPCDTTGFTALSEQRDITKKYDAMLVPLLSAAAALFALMVSTGRGEPAKFLWAYSILTLAVAPFTATLSFALPYHLVTRRLARFKTCVSGWTAARTFSDDGVAILTDTDLFPPGRVVLNGLKLFGEFPLNSVVSKTASMLAASGSGLISVFDDLLKDMNLPNAIHPVQHFEFYEGGGFSAELDDDRILVGNGAFMLRMGVSLPKKLPSKTAIYVAVNLSLACIFPLVYTADKGVKRSVRKLLRNRVPIVLACRDFNITPTFLKGVFREAAELADYPTVEQRLALSSPIAPRHAKPTALMNSGNLFSYTECLISGIRLRAVTRINLFFHTLCSVGSLLLFFYFTYFDGASALTPNTLLLFLLFFTAPIVVMSLFINRH